MTRVTKREEDTSIERIILIAMITSTEYLERITPIMDVGLLQSKFTRTVATWCMEYYRMYKKHPNKIIQTIFNAKAKRLDEATADAIETFLISISNEYDNQTKINVDYYCKQTESYFRQQSIKTLADEIKAEVLSGNIDGAEDLASKYQLVRMPESEGIDVFNDFNHVKKILNKRKEDVIFSFRGSLGNIANDNCRGDLMAFSAPEKRGKTWWLQEGGITSVLNGHDTVIFDLETLERQRITRIAQYVTGRPSREKDVGCDIPYLARDRIRYRKSDKSVLTSDEAVKKFKKLALLLRGTRLLFVCWPPGQKTISDIYRQLDIWEKYDDFIPSHIIVDHADRVRPERYQNEMRHGIDSVWEGLKGLAMDRHCLVSTATHSKLITTTKRITQATAAAEDKRKSGHVDRMIGLNQSEHEKKQLLMRVNVLYERDADSMSYLDVMVLHQFAIGRPYLDSYVEERNLEAEQ